MLASRRTSPSQTGFIPPRPVTAARSRASADRSSRVKCPSGQSAFVTPAVVLPPTGALLPQPSVGFVGRESELAAIREAFETVHLVLVEGLPGSGKSRLLEEAARRWSRGPVLRADGLSALPSRPGTGPNAAPQATSETARPTLVLADGLEGQADRGRIEAALARGDYVLAASRTRLPEPAQPARRLLVGGLSHDEAASLLASALTALGTTAPSRTAVAGAPPSPWTPPGFEALGGHPACILSLASHLASGHLPEPSAVVEQLLGASLPDACGPLLRTLSAVTVPLPRQLLDSLPGCDEQSLRTALERCLVVAGPEGVAAAPPLRTLIGSHAGISLLPLADALLAHARRGPRTAFAREALRLLAAAGELRRVQALLEEAGPALLAAGHVAEVELGLRMLSDQGTDKPELRLLRAELLIQTGRHEQARPLLEPSPSGSRTQSELRHRASLALALVQLEAGEREPGMARLDELAAGLGPVALKALKLRADAHYRYHAFGPAEADYRACLERLAATAQASSCSAELAPVRQGALAGLANLHRRSGSLLASGEFADRCAAELAEVASPAAVAAALTTRSTLEFLRGSLDEAAASTREAIRLRIAGGHAGGCAVALANLVQLEALRGRGAEAREANARLERLGGEATSATRAAAAKGMASLHLAEGRPLDALTAARQARELAGAWRDGAEEAECLAVLAAALLACDDPQAARTAAEQGLSLARRMESALAAADNLLVLSALELARGDAQAAQGRAEEASSSATGAGYALGRAAARLAQGEAHLAAEQYAESVTALEEAVEALSRQGARPLLARATERLAFALLSLGEWSRLLRLGGETQDQPELQARAALRSRAAAALDFPEPAPITLAGTASGPGTTLATVWRELRQGRPGEARTRLEAMPATGLTRAERVEEALLTGAALFGEGRAAAARGPLREAAGASCACQARTVARAALALLERTAGEAPSLENTAATAREPESTRRWLEALGFGGALENTRYVLVDGNGPSFVRENAPGAGQLEEMDLAVNLETQRVFLRDAGWLDLSGKSRPLELLALLAREHGRLLSKQRIYEAVWRRRYNAELNAVNVHQSIHRLRQLLQESGSSFDWVRTDQTTGCYGLAPDLRCGLWMRPTARAEAS